MSMAERDNYEVVKVYYQIDKNWVTKDGDNCWLMAYYGSEEQAMAFWDDLPDDREMTHRMWRIEQIEVHKLVSMGTKMKEEKKR
jgi:hypothetical protein